MFKRSKAVNTGATTWPPPMPNDVYQRNGIAPRPPPVIDREYDVHYGRSHPRSDHCRTHHGATNHPRRHSYVNSSLPRRASTTPTATRPYVPNHRIGGSGNVAPNSNHIPAPGYSLAPLHSSNHISQPSTERRYDDAPDAAAGLPPQAPTPRPQPLFLPPQNNNRSGNEYLSTTVVNQSPRPPSGSRSFLQSINPIRSIRRNSRKKNKETSKKIMRIYILSSMQPGNNIRVLCPGEVIKIATIPSPSNWVTEYDGNGSQQYFFRVEFDPSAPALTLVQPPPTQSNQPSTSSSSCNCVPRLGVFDSMCSEHGPPRPPSTSSQSNHQQDVQQNDDMSDMISVAQEDRAMEPGNFASFDSSVARNFVGWECRACGLVNDLELDACAVCYMMKHGMGEFGVREREMESATLNLK